MADRPRGTWGRKGNPSWTGPASALPARPVLSSVHPERHQDANEPVTRDDAPRDAGTPEFLTSRADWLRSPASQPADRSDPGDHRTEGDHRTVTSSQRRDAPAELVFAHDMLGGHSVGQMPAGVGGAANMGLRGDNALAFGNPEGYPLGTDYAPVAMQRAMPHGRMRGTLRAIGEVHIETGSASSPPPGGATSPFNPAAARRGFGPELLTQREVLRPTEDTASAYNLGTMGDGFMR